MHTGLFYCCKCCDGYGAVHCCGECCANTELGFGVNHTVACKHPCVKGAQRHDMTPVKKMHIKGNKQVDDDVLELPSSGVGRWNCCGAGCKVRHCRHSESPPHGHPHSVPHHHHAPPPAGRSPSSRSPNVSPAPSSASRSAARHYPLYPDPSLHPTYSVGAYASGGGGGGSTAGYSPSRGSGLGGGDSVMDTSASTVASSMAAAAAAAAAAAGGENRGGGGGGGTGPSSYAISPTSSSRCDECGVEEATAWCSNCEALFCPADFLAAHASKVGQRHTAIEINYAPSRCVEHPEVRAIFHCVDCAVDVCRLCCCRVTNPDGHHTHHRVVTLGDAERSSFAELKRRVDATKELKQDVDLRLRAASQRRKKAEEAGDDGRRRVGEVFSAVTAGVFRCLEKRRKEVLDSLEDVGAPVVAALTEEEAALGAASRGCGEAVATSVAVLLSNRSLKIVDSLSRTHDAADAAAVEARSEASRGGADAAVLPVVRLPETEEVLAELAPLIAGLGAVSSEAFAAAPPSPSPSPVPAAAAKAAAAAAAAEPAATTTPVHRPVRAAPSPAAKTSPAPAAATPSPSPPAQAQPHGGTAAAAAKASPAPVLPAATPSPSQPRAAAAEAATPSPAPSQQQRAAALSSLEREAIETEAADGPASPASSPPPPVEDEEEEVPEEEEAVAVGGGGSEPAAVSPAGEEAGGAAVVATAEEEEEEAKHVGAASEEDGGDAVFWCEGCEVESEGATCDVCVTECVVKSRRSL